MGKETFKEQVWNDATGTFYTQIVARIFSQTRQGLVGSPDILTEKHAVKRLLGMRTRGQATLEEGSGAHSKGIVLAKAGIKTPTHTTTVAEQNDYIVESFMNRIPQLPQVSYVPHSLRTDHALVARNMPIDVCSSHPAGRTAIGLADRAAWALTFPGKSVSQ